jgi:hypothetical protein
VSAFPIRAWRPRERLCSAQVPRLDWIDGAGQPQSLTQSLAIIEFLADACASSAAPSLLPNDALGRANCRQIAEIINSGTQPLQNLALLKVRPAGLRMLCCAVLCYATTLCYAMLRYATLCYAMLRYATLCYAMLR